MGRKFIVAEKYLRRKGALALQRQLNKGVMKKGTIQKGSPLPLIVFPKIKW